MKVAISLPDPIFDAAELLAQELRVSRSQLYTRALTEFLEDRNSSLVTARLNNVYAQKASTLPDDLIAAQTHSLPHDTW